MTSERMTKAPPLLLYVFDQVGGGNKEINFMSGQLYGCQNIEHGKSLCKAFKHDVIHLSKIHKTFSSANCKI